MEELISKIIKINSLSELGNLEKNDSNTLFLAIIKAERYDLLNNCNIKLHIGEDEVSMQIVDLLLSDEDISYYLNRNNYSFSNEDFNNIFKIICERYQDEYKFECFFKNLFFKKEELNTFVKDNEKFFRNYLCQKKKGYITYSLMKCDSFVELILKEKHIELIKNIEEYSLENLKLLVPLLKEGGKIPDYFGNDKFCARLFELKSNFELEEFYELLNLLKEKIYYDSEVQKRTIKDFSELVTENIDYLIELVSQIGNLPKCLVESKIFRDECIKKGRIDLAVKCLLPENIFQDNYLVKLYCEELKIDLKDFYAKGKWILDYYEKNNNTFNSLIATSLKDNTFNLGKEHFERFINDISIQMILEKLNDIEFKLLSEILKKYNYEDYDISFMISNILSNINDYSKLINSLDLSSITDQELKILISIMQLSKNPYNITDINDVRNYEVIKKDFFVNNYSADDIEFNKNNLLQLLFNIDINQAIFINKYYCYDKEKKVLEDLSNSELPKDVLKYLEVINKIVESQNLDNIKSIYDQYKNDNIYDLEVPLEIYLRSVYAKLYSESLFKIEEKENVYGPKDSIYHKVNYNGREIKICIPREKINFLVHVVGFCSHTTDIISSNYQKDWEDRPQIQDHFVACSYINEKKIYSIIGDKNIIFGFDSLEGSSLLGMGDGDIDSITTYAREYNSSQKLIEGNGNRAHYFVPSLLLNSNDNRYNEIVVERRNYNINCKKHFKRIPNYIIMMTDSLDEINFTCLNDLYDRHLSFINIDDRELIIKSNDENEIKEILVKYKEDIIKSATKLNEKPKKMLNIYLSLIFKSKYFEECLKASSEFEIPLVVVDRLYYFNKILFESIEYDEETKESILKMYSTSDNYTKREIFDAVALGKDLTKFFQKTTLNKFSIKL